MTSACVILLVPCVVAIGACVEHEVPADPSKHWLNMTLKDGIDAAACPPASRE